MMKNGSYILDTETVFTYDFSEEGFIEKVIEEATKPTYIIKILDENTIRKSTLDPVTGKEKVDAVPLLFEKEDTESAYIQKNKTQIKDSSESEEPLDNGESLNSSHSANTGGMDSVTSGMRNALKSAKDYLAVMSFSYQGLVEQLEYEGYSRAEAEYAVDNCGADWYEQAAKCAQSYLDIMSFSRSELIEQLEYEGFTHDQAVYGVNKVY